MLKGDGRGRGLNCFYKFIMGGGGGGLVGFKNFKNKKALMGFDSLIYFFFSDVITTIYLISYEVLSYGHFNSCWLDHIFTPNPFGVEFCV
jgi:hypothetical protein